MRPPGALKEVPAAAPERVKMQTLRPGIVQEKTFDCGRGTVVLAEHHAILTQDQVDALLEQARPEPEISDLAPFLGPPLSPDEVVLTHEDL